MRKRRRILDRQLAEDLTDKDLRLVSGGLPIGGDSGRTYSGSSCSEDD